jgi:Transcriptional regulator, AbiEi antitoxin
MSQACNKSPGLGESPGDFGPLVRMRSQTPKGPDAAVAELAAGQYGNVTLAQLLAAGLSRRMVTERVRQGRLFPVHRAVYAVGHPPRLPLERAMAAVLACGPDAALSHLGALAVWGFIKAWPDSFDVVVTADRRPQAIRTHIFRNLLPRDTTVQLGIPVTSPARTVLDSAPLLQNRRIIPDALHTPFLTQRALADVRARFPNHQGARLLDPFLEAGRNPTRSPFEDDFIAFCERYDLPRPETNVRVAGHTVDALFREQRLIVELDSWEFHQDRDAFETDRARDADTLAAGYRTLRITWDRLHDRGDAEADRLRRMLGLRRPT